MKLKPNKDVLAAQKAAANVHQGGAYEMKNGKAVLIEQPKEKATPTPKTK